MQQKELNYLLGTSRTLANYDALQRIFKEPEKINKMLSSETHRAGDFSDHLIILHA